MGIPPSGPRRLHGLTTGQRTHQEGHGKASSAQAVSTVQACPRPVGADRPLLPTALANITGAMTNTTNTHIPTIVYVEDNSGDALLLEEALREGGHAVQLLVIEDGAKALHYFKVKESARDVPPPHCILLDGFLPIITGGQLLRFIRGSRVYDDTPVYLFSSARNYQDLLQARLVSPESFITKADNWPAFQQLATLLMRSATAKYDHRAANPLSDTPEAPAPTELRRPPGETPPATGG